MNTEIETALTHINELKRNNRDKEYITASDVCARYSITSMTLWRWLNKPEVNFPKPLVISRHRYFRLADILAWENERAAA